MKRIAVVGTSLAGLRAAQALREAGYDGALTMVGAEPHQPYDRPPLSKEFLQGKAEQDGIALAITDDVAALNADWRLGVPATKLDTAAGTVVLADDTDIPTDGVVIATGGHARHLPGPSVAGVHVLRTLDDAIALRQDLQAGPENVVIIGAGFIGSEVAASCRALGLRVTVVEALADPLAPLLGPELAQVCARLHPENGVSVLYGTKVTGLSTVDGRVSGVRLADGRLLPAEVVVVGIGMRPATDWLTGSGLHLDNGVLTDAGCVTPLANVVAAGDVARYWSAEHDAYVRQEHWTNANDQPAVAVANLLAGRTITHYRASGYFWSKQYDAWIQYAGRTAPTDEIRIIDGSPEERKFVATYHRGDRMTGAFAINSPKIFTRTRKQLRANATDRSS
ncbi:NAD(P)/FAD-dependent oxidoreductase [Fodinicola feengrottensis]|uniref:NAD(P)/FAD-dependent oxidoreductase n=1 Tax=Fodinicola feengrottensis TaxID=435914 RepID=UPI0031D0A52B